MRPRTDEAKLQKIEAIYRRSRLLFPEVPELTVDRLPELQRTEKVVLVDVRKDVEQAVSMIPGAIPSQRFEENPDAYEGSTVVCYCTVGHRSGLFAKKLLAEGWKVYNLKGAILSWTHAGGELASADGPTRRVHVASRRFSLAAEGYEPVW